MAAPTTIVLTQGDPAGIGPEIILRALATWPRPANCRLIVLGYARHFEPHAAGVGRAPRFEAMDAFLARDAEPGVFFVSPGPDELNQAIEPGRASLHGSRGAIRCVEAAVDLAMAGRARAICTAPINKESLKAAGYGYPGHTEMLAERSGSAEFAMMLVGGGLRVALATIHEPLARVPALITREKLVGLLELMRRALPDFGFEAPRIGVAGLNPHAGEGGHIGREEIEIIAPAVAEALARGVDARGPFSADTLFHRAVGGEFDALLAMYHDQGLIPVKTLDFHGGVNATLGLPFARTSPDHGTAYDLAGKGRADPRSFIAALDLAWRLAERRAARG